MHALTTGTDQPGAGRRLSRRVLAPLLACGIALAGATTMAATLSAKDAARAAIDSDAAMLHAAAVSSLRQSGHVGAVAAIAQARGGTLRTAPADQPIPGGQSARSEVSRRVYAYNDGASRITIALPSAPIAAAGRRALIDAGATALALLLLMLFVVWRVLRRAAVGPLRELAAGVDRLAAGQPGRIAPSAGAREVRAVGGRLATVAARLAELGSQATTDPLTGVSNRRSFHTSLAAELKRSARDGRPLTLVLVDVDGFKEVNDTQGHPFGDGVLQLVAEKLRAGMRATDTVARVGGDEFAILLPGATAEGAEALVERARTESVGPMGGVELAWSAGVASFPTDAREAGTLLECADVALYCAKSAGGSGLCHYDPEQAQAPAGGRDRAALERLLGLQDAIVPVFQPIISLQSGRIFAYESLARFPHPPARRPDEWFASASACGLGPQLELRAVEAAMAPGGRPAGTCLSFNVSAAALMSDHVLAGLPADLTAVIIEITENDRMDDGAALAQRLEPLRARGARIAVDDAGAGYAGLQQVMRLRPDLIKLDRSLVANVDSDPAKAALVESFVRFAARTGAAVCAEGIETPEELRVLSDLDVAYGQGFGIARPAPPWAEIAPWVEGTLDPWIDPAEADPQANEKAPEETADGRLAALTARLATVSSSDELRGLATLMAGEVAADEVALLRRGSDAGALQAITDHRWLPAGSPIALSFYPTLRELLASHEVCQVQESDAGADLGELALLSRSGHRSMLLAPVVADGDAVGLMIALAGSERRWTPAETARARTVGRRLGTVIDALGEPAAIPEHA